MPALISISVFIIMSESYDVVLAVCVKKAKETPIRSANYHALITGQLTCGMFRYLRCRHFKVLPSRLTDNTFFGLEYELFDICIYSDFRIDIMRTFQISAGYAKITHEVTGESG